MPFHRFILILLLLGAAVGSAIVISASYRNARQARENLAHARQAIHDHVARTALRQRRADLLVDAVTMAGDGTVLSTTLLWRTYLLAEEGDTDQFVPMPVHTLTVPGDKVSISAVTVTFDTPPGAAGGTPPPDDTGFLQGLSVPLYAYLYGASQKPTDGTFLSSLDRVPGLFREYPKRTDPATGKPYVTPFDLAIWQRISNALDNSPPATPTSRQAHLAGLRFTWATPATGTLKPGPLYRVWLSANLGIEIQEVQDEPATIKAIRHALESQRAKDKAPADF